MVDATIDVVRRGTIMADKNTFLEAEVRALPNEQPPEFELMEAGVYNLVIDHPEGTILWDTGIHHEAGSGHWPEEAYAAFPNDAHDHRLDDDLAAAGWAIDDIDYVFQSHLHLDHAGGLEFFTGTDTPVFVHERELKHAYFCVATGTTSYLSQDFDHDLNWEVVYGDGGTYFEDVEFLHLPGHTPGVMGARVELDDVGTVVFTSDSVDFRANYEEERPMGPRLVWDNRAWYATLRRIKDLERRTDAQVVFGHDPEQLAAIADGWP